MHSSTHDFHGTTFRVDDLGDGRWSLRALTDAPADSFDWPTDATVSAWAGVSVHVADAGDDLLEAILHADAPAVTAQAAV